MITDGQIKQLAVSCGFKLTNETGDDLKPYVYEFTRDIIELAQQVKPLDWVFLDHYQTWISRGFDYDYIIPEAGDCYHLHYGDDVLCSSNSIDGLKKAAQQDYQRRVLSCLMYGGTK